ncbi:unnamed protein product [Aureobasidium pullulans]|nr:unnamed protein product [Aureobasidium pullulans]
MTHDFGSDSENDADFDGDPDLPGDSETVVEENKKEEKKKKKKRRGRRTRERPLTPSASRLLAKESQRATS